MKLLVLAFAALIISAVAAGAQTVTNLSIIVQSAPSTTLLCPINYPTGKTAFTAPVAAATIIAACSVSPVGWSGALTLSGSDAALFAISGFNLSVGATVLATPRTYVVTITATP